MKFFLLHQFLIATSCYAQPDAAYHYHVPVQLNDGLQTASLAAAGIDSNKLIALTHKIQSGQYRNIHSLLILRNNTLVYENYFKGSDHVIVMGAEDKAFMRSGWKDPRNNPIDSLHDARSISKSVVSACIGIAIAQRKIKSVDENIWTYFPEYQQLKTGLKSTMTIRHLLTMTSGLDVNESVSYGDSATPKDK